MFPLPRLSLQLLIIISSFLHYQHVESKRYLIEKTKNRINKPEMGNSRVPTEDLEHIVVILSLFALSSSNHIDCSVHDHKTKFETNFENGSEYNIEEISNKFPQKGHNELYLCPPCKKCKCCLFVLPMPIAVKERRRPEKPQHEREKRKKNGTSASRVGSGKKLYFYIEEECFCPQCPPCDIRDCKKEAMWKLPLGNKTFH